MAIALSALRFAGLKLVLPLAACLLFIALLGVPFWVGIGIRYLVGGDIGFLAGALIAFFGLPVWFKITGLQH